MYRLRKVNRKEARLLGVCGGISKYIDPEMDPAVVRILWTILTIFAPPFMILFYFILGLVLKTEKTEDK
jgi:phage shock protein C